ncbi:hypothetical protein FHT00_000492 [Sphingomonas insulae]|uniref:Uncharacterized protein n=2 Tax=Sphingomonas insulae TaxID=424800 RepID=A0ABN1HVL9_9SPHN|nr:hypothetical protein [Sphingomonas insulae]NIJ28564.1 hypothetical protein [Sphingomonas insulae]
MHVDRSALTPADHVALADVVTGRWIDCEDIVRELGGWAVARLADPAIPPPAATQVVAPHATSSDDTMPLVWTLGAVAEWRRLHRLLQALGGGGERHLAAILVATTVRLIVEAGGADGDVYDVPLLGAVTLRIAVTNGRMTVIGLREQAAIV